MITNKLMNTDNSTIQSKNNNVISKILILLAIIILISATAYYIYQKNDKVTVNPDKATPKITLNYNYTYLSSDIDCRELPTTPNTTKTSTFCTGKISLKTEGGNSKSYDLNSSSYFYINGAVTKIDKLNELQSGKSRVSLTFYDKNNTKVKGIYYVQ